MRMLCLLAVVTSSAAALDPPTARSPPPHPHHLVLNCSGLWYEQALQAAVAQGLLHRHHGRPFVWLSDIAEGLGADGQQDGAGYPGARFIEWKTGHAGGPWSVRDWW